MLYSIKELVKRADKNFNGNIAELMIVIEMELSGRNHDEIIRITTKNLQIMKSSVTDGLTPSKSISGLTDGDTVKMNTYPKSGKTLSDTTILTAVHNAIAVNGLNVKVGLVCVAPTAGSAGYLPAVLITAIDKLEPPEEEQLNFLFTVGAFGLVIGNNASISGTEGGCQTKVGSASAMSATALVRATGGSAFQASQAIAFAIKNMLGLIYNPVTGPVKVPCAKRNVPGSSFAPVVIDMVLAGIESRIPVDEVVDTMCQVGASLPTAFRETAEGGLAVTPTGR